MEKYLKIAARAWAGATLNIKKFADAYVEAVGKFRDEAMERFSAAYPMFGKREWRRLGQIGAGSLLPQFFFKSDFFVGKLLNMTSSLRIQKALVQAVHGVIQPKDLGLDDLQEQTKESPRTLKEAREAVERDVISRALRDSNANLTLAATILGIDRKVLREVMERLGIKKEDFRN